MEYLLIDAHQRFLGMMKSEQMLAIGDLFQGENAQTYAVVGVNWSGRLSNSAQLPATGRRHTLTVVAVHRQTKVADKSEPVLQLQ